MSPPSRHGLYTEKYIASTEDENTFRDFAASFIEEFEPQTASELELVDAPTHTAWHRRRIFSLISAYLNQALADIGRQDQRVRMENRTQSVSQPPKEQENTAPVPPAPPRESPESLTFRAYAHAENADASLPGSEISKPASSHLTPGSFPPSLKSKKSGTEPIGRRIHSLRAPDKAPVNIS